MCLDGGLFCNDALDYVALVCLMLYSKLVNSVVSYRLCDYICPINISAALCCFRAYFVFLMLFVCHVCLLCI